MRCATHTDVETNLRCGKCGKPICPKCLVQTPVGARCRECARLYKLPTFRVATRHYLMAAGAGLGMAVVFGLIWGVLLRWMPLLYLGFLIAIGVGWAIGEGISRSVNRKRGSGLAILAGVAVAVSYLVALFAPWGLAFRFLDLAALGLGIFLAVNRLR